MYLQCTLTAQYHFLVQRKRNRTFFVQLHFPFDHVFVQLHSSSTASFLQEHLQAQCRMYTA